MSFAAIPEEISRHIDAVLVLSRKEILLKLLDEADKCLEQQQFVAATVLARVAAEEVYSFKGSSFPVEQRSNIEILHRFHKRLTHPAAAPADLKKDDIQLLLGTIRALIGNLSKPESSASRSEFERLVTRIQGKYAFLHTSVDDFLARKREDLELER